MGEVEITKIHRNTCTETTLIHNLYKYYEHCSTTIIKGEQIQFEFSGLQRYQFKNFIIFSNNLGLAKLKSKKKTFSVQTYSVQD